MQSFSRGWSFLKQAWSMAFKDKDLLKPSIYALVVGGIISFIGIIPIAIAAVALGTKPRRRYLKQGRGWYWEVAVALSSGRFGTLCKWEDFPATIEVSLELVRREFFYEEDLLEILALLKALACRRNVGVEVVGKLAFAQEFLVVCPDREIDVALGQLVTRR